ncbi:P63C domain-containing protein [Pantoea sp. ACRSB]|uniref:P63C domain-containing protein n=1 Tax=Pantoea sp. ACRSB TaxID=2918207 RepID=UPI0028934258|nr:P63C domain-containing protein [Pantoea sp. ACRSB]MCG7388789.1 P63C domain-containing protein [Pantoea sp. ACRSB]
MDPKKRAVKAAAVSAAVRSAPKPTHTGLMSTGVSCAVLPDGRRVVSMQGNNGLAETFGVSVGSKMPRWVPGGEAGQLPYVLQAAELQPYISDELRDAISEPIVFKNTSGVGAAYGLDATLLPELCEVWLSAEKDGALKQRHHLNTARKAEALYKALARVGAVALVDEATGYQKERERDELAKLLEQFIAKEMRPWVRVYPPEFFEELCRLRGVPFKANMRKPQYFGHLVNNITYDRMAPDLKAILKEERARANKQGAKMHQFLSEGVGNEMLQKRFAGIVTLMKVCDNYDDFIELLERVHPVLKGADLDASDVTE